MTENSPAIESTSADKPHSSVSTGRVALGILHIAALSAIAVAQPIFDLLGKNAEFFVARSSEPIDIWLMAAGLVVAIPAFAAIVEFGARLISDSVYRIVHSFFIGGLAAAIALQILTRVLSANGLLLVALALLAGVAFAIAYGRFDTLRSFATWLSVAPVAFVIIFLFFTPVSRLIFPSAVAFDSDTVKSAETPVVIIVWDEINSVGLTGVDGSIDAEAFPNFALLAEDATVYQRASGVSDASSLAVPSILDGMFPDADLLPIASDHPRSLYAVLGESHEVVAREPATAVCPRSICEDSTPEAEQPGLSERLRSLASDLRVVYLRVLLPADLTEGLPPIDRVWGSYGANAASLEGTAAAADAASASEDPDSYEDRTSNEYIREELSRDRVAAVREFIDNLPTASDRPPFVFLDAALPHAPYRYAPSGLQYRGSGELFGTDAEGRWIDDDWVVGQGEQRYLMQTQIVDDLVGDVLDWLVGEGLYDDALVIVTADHGVGFTPGDYVRTVTPENFGETMSVPLIVKLPGQSGGAISHADARTIDIFPTVLDVLGVDADWGIDGRSLLLEPIDRGPKKQIRTDGVVVESDPTMPAWDVAIANKVRRFGTASGRMDVYRPGRTSIAGMSVTALDVANDAEGSARVDALESIQDYDPSLGISPTHVTGTIQFDRPVSGDFAIAVNGVVQVVGPVLRADPNGGRFSYFVPEDAFGAGVNTIALFWVRGAADRPELVPIEIEAALSYTLGVDADGSEYLEQGDVRIPVGGQLSGGVDAVTQRGSTYSIAGWSADTQVGQPADEIVVVADGTAVVIAPPNLRRPDVGNALGDPVYSDGGFSVLAPVAVIDRAASVRVFGVTAGTAATELPLPDGAFGR